MRKARFATVLVAGLTALAACSSSEPESAEPAERTPSPELFTIYESKEALAAFMATVRDGYVASLREVGIVPPFEPKVEVRTTPNTIFYEDRTVHAPLYSEIAPEFRSLLAEWGGGEAAGKELFAAAFQWFFLAHELSHYLQEIRGVVWDGYELEQHANDAAVAYWMGTPGGPERLSKLDTILADALPRMKTQVFPGGLDRGTFNRRKADIDLVPTEYGFAQFTMVRSAIARRAELSRAATLAKVTEGGVDCAPIGPRIEAGCARAPDGVEACRATLTFLSQRHVAECDGTRKALLECYVGATQFTCSPNPTFPPLPPACESSVGAHMACLRDNGVTL
jgi:hypothetical protein